MAIWYTPRAARSLDRMGANQSARSRARIEQLQSAPDIIDVRRLAGRPGLRLRAGPTRVLFVQDDNIITILDVLPRAKATR